MGERIATPVCEPARNDRVFNGLPRRQRPQAFHMAKPYFTREAVFHPPVGGGFRWKKHLPKQVLSACQKSFRPSEAAKRPWESVALKVAVFLKVWIKSEDFRERIATPVCEPARNDRFFDSLSNSPPDCCIQMGSNPSDPKKNKNTTRRVVFLFWRRERDSNPW